MSSGRREEASEKGLEWFGSRYGGGGGVAMDSGVCGSCSG